MRENNYEIKKSSHKFIELLLGIKTNPRNVTGRKSIVL